MKFSTGVGIVAVLIFAIGALWTVRWAFEPRFADCVERDDRLSQFATEISAEDLAVTGISSFERIEPRLKFVCELVRIETVIDDRVEFSDWARIRRTNPGVADDPFFGRIMRDNVDYTGTSPEVRGSRYIFREGCVTLTGRHDFAGDAEVQERLGVLFDELVEAIPC